MTAKQKHLLCTLLFDERRLFGGYFVTLRSRRL